VDPLATHHSRRRYTAETTFGGTHHQVRSKAPMEGEFNISANPQAKRFFR
jgi:hypothetical protein